MNSDQTSPACNVSALASDANAGEMVTFIFGHGESRRRLVGTVVGVNGYAGNKRLRVSVGEGYDLAFLTIRARAVLARPNVSECPAPTYLPAVLLAA